VRCGANRIQPRGPSRPSPRRPDREVQLQPARRRVTDRWASLAARGSAVCSRHRRSSGHAARTRFYFFYFPFYPFPLFSERAGCQLAGWLARGCVRVCRGAWGPDGRTDQMRVGSRRRGAAQELGWRAPRRAAAAAALLDVRGLVRTGGRWDQRTAWRVTGAGGGRNRRRTGGSGGLGPDRGNGRMG
jgi:hypothetical protein